MHQSKSNLMEYLEPLTPMPESIPDVDVKMDVDVVCDVYRQNQREPDRTGGLVIVCRWTTAPTFLTTGTLQLLATAIQFQTPTEASDFYSNATFCIIVPC